MPYLLYLWFECLVLVGLVSCSYMDGHLCTVTYVTNVATVTTVCSAVSSVSIVYSVQCSVQCSVVQCGAVQCGAVWCSAVWCSVVQCGAVWYIWESETWWPPGDLFGPRRPEQPAQRNGHWILHTAYCTLHTAHCKLTLYTAQCTLTLYTLYCTLNTEHGTLHTAHCTLHSTNWHFILYTLHCTLNTAHGTLHTARCTLHSLYCISMFLNIRGLTRYGEHFTATLLFKILVPFCV